jgi:hypothetical protein
MHVVNCDVVGLVIWIDALSHTYRCVRRAHGCRWDKTAHVDVQSIIIVHVVIVHVVSCNVVGLVIKIDALWHTYIHVRRPHGCRRDKKAHVDMQPTIIWIVLTIS